MSELIVEVKDWTDARILPFPQPDEPEQRYVVVDLGAEAAGSEKKYVYNCSLDGSPAHAETRRIWFESRVTFNTESKARNMVDAAFKGYGWHCEVRPWPEPEKLWCVRLKSSRGNISYINPRGRGSTTSSQKGKPVNYGRNETPVAMTREQADEFAVKCCYSALKYGLKVLPYPPPAEKPQAVKWAVRLVQAGDKNPWRGPWRGDEGATDYPQYFENKVKAQHECEWWQVRAQAAQYELVGFDADGNEVEE